MSKLQKLRVFVNQRLTSAVEEIFVLFERTITEYEDEVSRSKEENERQRKLLDAVLRPEFHSHRTDVQELLVQQEWSSSMAQDDPKSPHVKEEQEELWSHQEREKLQGLEEADITKISSTPVPVKSEGGEEEAQLPQLHQTQIEENREGEPPGSSPTEQIKTESDEEDCGGPEPVWDLDPATEDKDSDSFEPETDVSSDWKETREAQSVLEALKNKQGPLSDLGSDNVNKSFICSECDKRFGSKSALMKHMRIHTGEKPFICSVCGKGFNHKGHLNVHMRLHSGEKPFSCSVCGKRFTHKGSLTVHTRLHSGEKPFSCSVCGERFTHKPSLTGHMQLHSGEKSFNCSVCGKGFTQKPNLTVHMRLHSGEKPLSCSVLDEIFTHKESLNVNMKHLRNSVCGENLYTSVSSECPHDTPVKGETI